MRRRSLVVMVAQRVISSMERPQPMHKPVSRSMSQMLTQGVSIERFAFLCDAPMESSTQLWGYVAFAWRQNNAHPGLVSQD